MKKLLIILLVLFLSACQKKSSYEDKMSEAHQMNEIILYEETTFEVTQVGSNLLGYSIYPNEDLIYVFFDYEEELRFTSNDLKVMLEDDKQIDAYMIDGLDYLTGPAKASNPYVRFSVPKGINKMLLIISNQVYIYLVWE